MSELDQEKVRQRIWREIIEKEVGLLNELNLARDIGAAELYDRSAVRKIMRGERGISRGFLDAIEQLYGFKRRHYVETGKWPNDETQAEQIAKLPKEEFQALLDLAASPGVRDFLIEVKSSSPEDLEFLQELLRADVSLVTLLMKAMAKSEEAADEEAEIARIRRIAQQVRDKYSRKKKGKA